MDAAAFAVAQIGAFGDAPAYAWAAEDGDAWGPPRLAVVARALAALTAPR